MTNPTSNEQLANEYIRKNPHGLGNQSRVNIVGFAQWLDKRSAVETTGAVFETDERYNVSDALVERLRDQAPNRDYFEALSDLLRLRAKHRPAVEPKCPHGFGPRDCLIEECTHYIRSAEKTSASLCQCGVALPAPGRPCAICGTVKPSPADLVDALQDRVHKDIGVTRPAQAVKASAHMVGDRCSNWPCQLLRFHDGPCSTAENGTTEPAK